MTSLDEKSSHDKATSYCDELLSNNTKQPSRTAKRTQSVNIIKYLSEEVAAGVARKSEKECQKEIIGWHHEVLYYLSFFLSLFPFYSN